jgi:hypothetical protein
MPGGPVSAAACCRFYRRHVNLRLNKQQQQCIELGTDRAFARCINGLRSGL